MNAPQRENSIGRLPLGPAWQPVGGSGQAVVGRRCSCRRTIENEHSFCQPDKRQHRLQSRHSRATVERERPFVFHGGVVPRVSAQHEQEVRERIVRAATRVFSERGFHRATMQDIVRASGLSVGAIYTYFKSKDELILAGCDLITDQEMTELARRVAPVEGYPGADRDRRRLLFDKIELESSAAGQHPPARARPGRRPTPSPAIREMLLRRRREVHGVAVGLIQEGIAARRVPGVARDRPDRGRARRAPRRRRPRRASRRAPATAARTPSAGSSA